MDLLHILKQPTITKTDELIEQMLIHVGASDPYLRDSLIFAHFQDWIMNEQLTDKQLEKILTTSLSQSLYHIGQTDDDTVFTRSFSVLLCALVLAHSQVTEDVYTRSFEVGCEYMEKEEDLRGYVPEKGWAHSIAHGADLLTVLASHRHFQLQQLDSILQSIKTPLLKGTVFIDDEQERLTAPLLALIDRHDQSIASPLTRWLHAFYEDITHLKEGAPGKNLSFFRARTNSVHFLMTLHFSLQTKNTPFATTFNHELEQTIQSLRKL